MARSIYLNRREAARHLTALGYKIAPATLAKKACAGDGPDMIQIGARVGYRPEDLEHWIDVRTKIKTSTSDAGRPLKNQGDM